ncbi:MAG: hypothetical protein KF770_16010 [Anaerolineae bacterium]|nr:hypothetical protein [Anaerolineae bacterium]
MVKKTRSGEGFVQLPGNGGHKRPEYQDSEGHGEGHFHHDQAKECLVYTWPLQEENGGHNGRWDDQPCQHKRTHHRRQLVAAPLHHKSNQSRE